MLLFVFHHRSSLWYIYSQLGLDAPVWSRAAMIGGIFYTDRCVCVCVCVRSALYSSESNIRNDMLSVSGHSLLFPVQITAQVGSSGQFH